MSTMRTDNEVKAFSDGYKLCYQQFVDLLKSNCEVGQVIEQMEIGLTTVNAAVEVIDTYKLKKHKSNKLKDVSTDYIPFPPPKSAGSM